MPFPRRISEEELRLFSERIARSLAERPVDMPEMAHREDVANLLRQVGGASSYEILGIDSTAPIIRIHEAYEKVARVVHPRHAPRLHLEGREGVLELLFEKVTESYLILSDPESRKRYDRELPGWKPPAEPALSRAEEAQRLYERARTLAGGEQYHAAIELLREAVRTTPKGDYLAMLGLLQAKNPLWLRGAEENLRRAISAGAKDPSLPMALAEVQRRLDSGETTGFDPNADSNADSKEVEIL